MIFCAMMLCPKESKYTLRNLFDGVDTVPMYHTIYKNV